MSEYGMQLTFQHDRPGGEYQIYECSEDVMHGMDSEGNEAGVVWRRAYDRDEDLGEYSFPIDMRREYERLTGKPEFDPKWNGSTAVNLVEIMDEEQGFGQPCRYGNLCSGHAVYCHNAGWLYRPRKCRRTWYTGSKTKDEDCPGFAPNPVYQKDH